MTGMADSDRGLQHEGLYTAHAVYEPRVLDDWPLAEGDIRYPVFVAILEAVRTVRRERGRLAMPWIHRALEQQVPAAVVDAAAKWLAEMPPYEPEIEPIVLSLRERGACARAHEIAQQIAKASARGKWTEVQQLQAQMAGVTASGQHAHRIYSAADAMLEGLCPESHDGVSIPFEGRLNRIIRLAPKTRLVLGAGTNIGKTSLIAKWLDTAEAAGHPAALVSCEDPVPSLGRKWLASAATVRATSIRDGDLSPGDRSKAAAAIDAARGRRLFAVHVEDRTLSGVLSSIRACAALGAKLVAVDYLQAIRCDGEWNRAKDKVDFVMNEILACASVANVALILASQFKRQDTDGKSKTPTMALLKESGDIENAATYVLLAWRTKDDSGAPIYCRVAKVKDGPGIGHTIAWQRDPDGVLRDYDLPAKVSRGAAAPDNDDWGGL